ncbi:sodium/glucose cotransporter 4-like [Ylistrum balloti]|uniref:sodium/glucose cotransporter 4-like n=1 Tax=Ylistrum balloti TaxID=509963 RepID=UPI002905DECF|nr:sodium/glucose cotransporter 4-like [Ylistrum balloti]
MATPGLDHWADITVVVLYFICVLIVGMWTVCRRNRNDVNSYFLAGRNIAWWPVGASLFSSNIGSEHFVGLAGTGAAAGIAMISYEWFSMPLVLLLGWFFLPVYISAGVYTLPEYMEKRFGGYRIRIYLSVLALILYIVTKLAVSIFAGALFIQLALGWDMYLSILALLGVTAVYTILGGLAAVIYTDTFQTAIMTIGALALVGISFNEIGGYNNLERKYMDAIPAVREPNSTCGFPRDDAFHIFRDPITGDNPWPGLLLQSSLGCLWYWCCDQVIVQRSLAAKNLSHAKGGSILAGYLKLLPLFLMIFPGMISRALYPDEVACVDPEVCKRVCDNPVGCSNIAYPKLVLELLPFGVRGLLMAVMLSAIMSSLTSIFNSSSTIFTMDLWRRARPRATERELLIVGRIFIVILCGISIAWIPLVRSSQGGQLFNYIQAIQGYLGTPIGALFILGVFWKRMNEQGAFWGILIGHICGVIRMAIDFANPAPECGEPETRPSILLRVHYTYFGSIMILVTSVAIIIISLLTHPQREEELEGVTWWTRLKPEDKGNNSTVRDSESAKENNPATNGIEIAEPEDERPTGCAKRACDYICGMPENETGSTTPSTDETQIRKFLKENKRWTRVLNVNAAIGLIVTAFLYGFYR